VGRPNESCLGPDPEPAFFCDPAFAGEARFFLDAVVELAPLIAGRQRQRPARRITNPRTRSQKQRQDSSRRRNSPLDFSREMNDGGRGSSKPSVITKKLCASCPLDLFARIIAMPDPMPGPPFFFRPAPFTPSGLSMNGQAVGLASRFRPALAASDIEWHVIARSRVPSPTATILNSPCYRAPVGARFLGHGGAPLTPVLQDRQ